MAGTPRPRTSRRLRARCCAVLALAAVFAARPSLSSPSPAAEVELSFELTATARSPALDAFVRARARLLLTEERGADGRRHLRLITPLEPASKLYAVDPAGPFGEEAKLAAVATLPEPSWAAVDAARAAVDALGRAQFTRFREETGSRLTFDGSFAFLVIGPPAGRFAIELARDGRLEGARDRLTDRWLTGELDPLLKAWQSALASGGKAPEGYWFWNRGEARPFAWEPHTYHALEAALALLREPAGALRESARASLSDLSWRVLATLAPKLGEQRGRTRGGEALSFTRVLTPVENRATLLLEHERGRLEMALALTPHRDSSAHSSAQSALHSPAAHPPIAARSLVSASQRTSSALIRVARRVEERADCAPSARRNLRFFSGKIHGSRTREQCEPHSRRNGEACNAARGVFSSVDSLDRLAYSFLEQ